MFKKKLLTNYFICFSFLSVQSPILNPDLKSSQFKKRDRKKKKEAVNIQIPIMFFIFFTH